MRSSHWTTGGLLLVWALAPPVHARRAHHASEDRVPTAQAQAFALGFSIQSAAARTRQFLDAVKSLRDVADDEEGAAEVARLAEQSGMLRRTEARSYAETGRQLHAMGAPPDLLAWTRDVFDQLQAPLKLSQEVKKEQKSDPNTATVLATIDEAQALKVTADSAMPRLRAWVKLSYGAPGAWAGALGDLAAEMDAAVRAERPLSTAALDIEKLAQEAPSGTPQSVTQALKKLTPKRGNLAAAVRAAPAPVPFRDLNAPLRDLLDAFDARPLSETLANR